MQGLPRRKRVTDLLLFPGLHRAPNFCNPFAMIQLSFGGRSITALRHALVLFIFGSVALCSWSLLYAEDPSVAVKWVAPAAQAQKANPVKADAASIEAGRKIYLQRCA